MEDQINQILNNGMVIMNCLSGDEKAKAEFRYIHIQLLIEAGDYESAFNEYNTLVKWSGLES